MMRLPTKTPSHTQLTKSVSLSFSPSSPSLRSADSEPRHLKDPLPTLVLVPPLNRRLCLPTLPQGLLMRPLRLRPLLQGYAPLNTPRRLLLHRR
ncbi:hypothetical protein MRX96_033541 [Rhipicephalus microplus]